MMMQLMESPSAFPSGWIDRLFERLAALYGRHWLEMWADIPMADVKDAWASALAGISGERVAAALKALGKFPPTLPEFVSLCKPAATPAAHRAFLPAPRDDWKTIDTRIKAEIDALLEKGRKRDPKDWARKILAEASAGMYTFHYGIQCAKEALSIE
jgi:hypothetical protein